ncbi:MAG: tyrosine-type recombinase/integrase [Gammaproteobacteria bacterium]|nr:tyrosine-type recombinase/integrase [Gammaproteobacteria bacterium]NIR84633.1 tyrosine-type recombinase/integrase [Gammaproteobacteria bacterium]NIR90536.1 tyrosine-type recombinase/integrase [Gammaproteobacteria bacterium]NIU05684.1 tyrosine-type recombinase/integrase [Gammaproteobacteria bacterium]NIV52823.1 tyrosine-type recombinase/integrase [Gammaproteobacteria bacterium]
MIEQFFPDPALRERFSVGPLASHIDGFASLLLSQGYARSTAKEKLRLVADLSRWLHRRRLALAELDEQRVSQFLTNRRRRRLADRRDAVTCRTLLGYLRALDRIPSRTETIEDTPLSRMERDFGQFLASERGLTRATLVNYLPIVRRFLTERFGSGELRLDELCPRDVYRFVLRNTPRMSRTRAKLVVTALRSFLRFLRQRGDVTIDLAGAVPAVVNWRLSGLPKSLAPEEVERLLASCEQSTPLGRRDHAILLLLARLGLRAGEVITLTLDDLDWEAGALVVRGKGHRHEQLPLPQDVGEALVSYLRHGRPPCDTRRFFVRLHAPQQGFSSSAAICDVVRRALARAGLEPALKGAHLLRHSLATRMLQSGASLGEIGEILRHCRPETTQIYAKVDVGALRALAQPWPGGAP